jgi:hypothetical protein
MSEDGFRQNLHSARPFGCLLIALLAPAMGFIVFVGSIMGDCAPDERCHADDGPRILYGFFMVAVISLSFGALTWLFAAVLRIIIRPLAGGSATNIILVVLVLLLVWFGFSPAMELLLSFIAPSAAAN